MNAIVLKNRTYDELQVGDTASLGRIAGRDDIDLFAKVSGDVNHVRFDPVGRHIRVDAWRHISWRAASPRFAGRSTGRARQRHRAAWSWADRDDSRVGSRTAHRSRSSQADHRRPDPARPHSGPVWPGGSSGPRWDSRSLCNRLWREKETGTRGRFEIYGAAEQVYLDIQNSSPQDSVAALAPIARGPNQQQSRARPLFAICRIRKSDSATGSRSPGILAHDYVRELQSVLASERHHRHLFALSTACAMRHSWIC